MEHGVALARGDGQSERVSSEGKAPRQEAACGMVVQVSASYVLAVVEAVHRCDWALARYFAREAVIERAKEAWET